MTDQEPPAATPAEPADSSSAESRETWLSQELLGDRSEVLIKHGNEVYRLRRTRQDKLILYK